MSVSIRDLRNSGGRVLDRVERGEVITVTRNGIPVAELRPVPRRARSLADLDARFAGLPAMDDTTFRRDVDALIDPLV